MDLLKNSENSERGMSVLKFVADNMLKVPELSGYFYEEREKILRGLITSGIKAELKNGTHGGMIQEAYNAFAVKTTKIYSKFITVSFKPNTNPDIVKESIQVYQKRSFVNTFQIAHEQRSEQPETLGEGYHIHMLISMPKSKPNCELIRETYSTFKNYVEGKNFIDVRHLKTQTDVDNIKKYMSGDKSDDKLLKSQMDILFKKKYNVT
nr:MAG TPA: Rep protein [Cressdnaviricota sp.]